MKRRSQVPCETALRINEAGDQPIHLLDSASLDRHLENIHILKMGWHKSFGVDLRSDTFAGNATGNRRSVLFNYLSEVVPLVEPQADRMPEIRRIAYDKLVNSAIQSFWEIYYRFQPLIQREARRTNVEVDDLGNVLGRTILLYEKGRGFKFCSYLKKTLRESVKNLRGSIYAHDFRIPLSAGRLIPQMLWLLDQESLRLQRRLTADESDDLLLQFLQQNPAKFSDLTMRRIVRTVRTHVRTVSISQSERHSREHSLADWIPVSNDHSIETQDEYEHVLQQVHKAVAKAGFTPRETAIVLQRLELSFDQDLYRRIEAELTKGSLRNRRSQLLVRFMAAMHCAQAKHFGRFLLADPLASKPVMNRYLRDLAERLSLPLEVVITGILNHMSLGCSVYRLTIAERGRLETFLNQHPMAQKSTVSGHLYNKWKAALIDQDRQGFPCLRQFFSD